GQPLLTGHERDDLGAADALALLGDRPGRPRVHGEVFDLVDAGEQRRIVVEQPAVAGDQRERAGRLGLDFDPFASERCREPLAGRVLVDVAGLKRHDVQLGPGQLREPLELLGPEDAALVEPHTSSRPGHVLRQDRAGRGQLALLDPERPHGVFAAMAAPVRPLRAATTCATTLRAISAAVCAPMSNPTGTWTRATCSSGTPW